MNYQKKKNYNIFLAVIALLIFLYFTGLLSPLETIISRIASPVLAKLYNYSLSVGNIYTNQADKRDLLKEIGDLNEKINKLVVENASFKTVNEENMILRDYLSFFNKEKFTYKMANVISGGGMNNTEGRKTLIIDQGEKDGLKPGLAVVDRDGVVVGLIISSKENISEICVISDKNCKMAATIQNNDKTAGVIQGELGLAIKMDFIPQNEKVSEGDIVVTSGLEEEIPLGLAIGRVIEVEKKNNEIWQSASIEPLAGLKNISIVAVVFPY